MSLVVERVQAVPLTTPFQQGDNMSLEGFKQSAAPDGWCVKPQNQFRIVAPFERPGTTERQSQHIQTYKWRKLIL
jgi:hypothetical protein